MTITGGPEMQASLESQAFRYQLQDMLQKALDEQGLSYADAARKFGCTRGYVSMVIHNGGEKTIIRWLSLLGYHIHMVLEKEGDCDGNC